jgi:hypothetical protein
MVTKEERGGGGIAPLYPSKETGETMINSFQDAFPEHIVKGITQIHFQNEKRRVA